MANCPNCGSEHIQLQQNKNVNWGRAVAGWALFGAVGAAVGAVTGDDQSSNVCLDCGTAWKATALYKSKATFKAMTQKELDLGKENDRFLLNHFMEELSPYLKAASEEEENRETEKFLEKNEYKKRENKTLGCMVGGIAGIGGCFVVAPAAGGTAGFLLFIVAPIVCFGLGYLADKTSYKKVEDDLKQLKLDKQKARRKAEKELELKVKDFIIKNGHKFKIENP